MIKTRGLDKLLACGAIVAALFGWQPVSAQQVSINTAGTPADASAVLHVQSTSHGMLTPRMTKAQRNAIAAPALGLLVYQTDEMPGFRFFDGTEWQFLRGMVSVPGRINTEEISCNTTLDMPSYYTGFSHTVDCLTGEGQVNFPAGIFQYPPVVNINGAVLPVPPPAPDIYCIPNYTAPCNVSFNADQVTGVRVQHSTTGALGPWTQIMQHLSICDNPGGGNYVEVPQATATCTMNGNIGACGANNWYRIEIRSSTEWNDRVQAWIDWNADGDFFDGQEHIAPVCDFGLSGVGGAFLSSTPFQVPNFALNGNTVMRCRSIWVAQCNPCTGGTFGETEDYTITVQCATSGPAPEIPSYCAISDVTTTSFDFKCTLLSGAPVIPPLINFDMVPSEEP